MPTNTSLILNQEENGNLWITPSYRRGVITLRDTYWDTTYNCVAAFTSGKWDHTFDCLLRYGFGVLDKGSRVQVMQDFALTNYLEAVYPTNGDRSEEDYENSKAPYGNRITRLRPVVNLILAGRGYCNQWAADVTGDRSPETKIILGFHPREAHYKKALRRVLAELVNRFVSLLT
jgi:hypothetical protein